MIIINISLALKKQSKLSRMSVLNMVDLQELFCHGYTRLDMRTQLYSFGQTTDRVAQEIFGLLIVFSNY